MLCQAEMRCNTCVVLWLSHIWLFWTPWTLAHQTPLFMGFSRQEYWSEFPFPSPGDLPNPEIKPASLALAGRFSTTEPPGKPHINYTPIKNLKTKRKKSRLLPASPNGRLPGPTWRMLDLNTCLPQGTTFLSPLTALPQHELYRKGKESEVAQSCPTLCNPMDGNLPGSAVHGIFQARILEWAAVSFSRGSSQPRDRTQVFCIADRRFTVWATAPVAYIYIYMHTHTKLKQG